MKLTAQILIICFMFINFFRMLYTDINGRPAKEPKGFEGIVTSFLALALVIIIYYFAGAFSSIF